MVLETAKLEPKWRQVAPRAKLGDRCHCGMQRRAPHGAERSVIITASRRHGLRRSGLPTPTRSGRRLGGVAVRYRAAARHECSCVPVRWPAVGRRRDARAKAEIARAGAVRVSRPVESPLVRRNVCCLRSNAYVHCRPTGCVLTWCNWEICACSRDSFLLSCDYPAWVNGGHVETRSERQVPRLEAESLPRNQSRRDARRSDAPRR